jgi:hypothetical protein
MFTEQQTKTEQLTINIKDNDVVNPAQKVFSVVLMDEKFENVSSYDNMPIWMARIY